jgi:hypothetical protein
VKRLVAQVPHGFQVGNTWIRHVDIRELNGYDEQLIASSQNYFPPFKTSLLLANIVKFNTQPQLDPYEVTRNLSVGDRVALILQLRKITFGEILYCMIQCPHCKENLSTDLPLNSLLIQPAAISNPQTLYPLELEGYTLKIRPLNGADLETIAANQTPNAAETLLRLAIVSSDPKLPNVLSSTFQEQLGEKLSNLDPQADLTLNITCSLCNKTFQSLLDIEDFFFQEINSRLYQLEREIHWIAFNYHWDEKTILSLPLSKRKRYVELINTTLAGEGV